MWSKAEATIRHACYIGQLKARTIPGLPGAMVPIGLVERAIRDPVTCPEWVREGETEDAYIIHRDDARRYFAALDMMPAEGSALRCWLDGKAAGKVPAKRKNQRDREEWH